MDTVLTYFAQNLLFTIVFAVVSIFLISRWLSPGRRAVRKQDLVPAHKRFERRDDFEGNRRQPSALPFLGVERRLGLRRHGV